LSQAIHVDNQHKLGRATEDRIYQL
jgi:hypothetical protein